ncbi:anoctamin-7-like [Pseudoliparis swirei]|uniref:anoctamin-7-like n=1 Tax=Pseudoliparis swirei TaxID=2059687 RepID=UPI0024BE601D|nr:anoctamin-7-like [Pseudoliparis swirei]
MRRRGEGTEDLIAMEAEKGYGSITTNAPVQRPDRNVFSDGTSRVDFVLVWEEPLSSREEESKGVGPAHQKVRNAFLNQLRDSGLLQEQKEVLEEKTRTCFVLLSAPWNVLCYYAEEISLRVPLKVVTAPITNWSAQVLTRLSLPNPLDHEVPNPPPDFYTCQFRTNKLPRFLGSDNKETFFKTTQRHQLLYEILARTPYGSVTRGEVGIDRLLTEQVFTAAYPLHEVCLCVCVCVCVCLCVCVCRKELCDSRNSFNMCPLCHICTYWNYSSICVTFKAGIMFDNGGTVFFSVFMSLWAVTFLEFWKRTCLFLSHRWDCSEFQDIEERPRPEFTAMAPMTMRSPVTGAEEPYFPEKKRFNRTVTGFMVVILMVAVVLMFLMAVILYRSIITVCIHRAGGFLMDQAGRVASISGSVLNLLVILMLSRFYTSLAHILTRWEMHRTQSKYEDMFILKVFIFQFVNFYSSPVYIAFFKGRFVGYPGNYQTLFGVRNEDVRYHVLVSSCPRVIMSSCHHVLMSSCPHVIMSSCHHVLVSSCHHVLVSSCPHVIMSSCHHVLVSSCPHVLMSF